jgi:hypothetical protein
MPRSNEATASAVGGFGAAKGVGGVGGGVWRNTRGGAVGEDFFTGFAAAFGFDLAFAAGFAAFFAGRFAIDSLTLVSVD